MNKNAKTVDYLKRVIPIQSYAEHELGITEWKQGRSYISPDIKFARPDANDYSSLVIDPEKNCFWRNSGKGKRTTGSIIDFIMCVKDCSLDEAIDILIDYGNMYLNDADMQDRIVIKKNLPIANKEFRLPLKYKNDNRLYAYIVKHRQIEPEIYHYFVDNGYMYQSRDCKCIFVSYENDTPVFACVRDTNWNRRITYGVAGSKTEHGFYIDNGSKTLVVTEAVIDAMAYMSLCILNNIPYKSYNYLALTGCSKIQCIKYHCSEQMFDKIILAYDNDSAGNKAYKKTLEMLKEMNWKGRVVNAAPKEVKDINDQLIAKKAITKTKKG